MKTFLLLLILSAKAIADGPPPPPTPAVVVAPPTNKTVCLKLAWNRLTNSYPTNCGPMNYVVWEASNNPTMFNTNFSAGTNCCLIVSNLIPTVPYWFCVTGSNACGGLGTNWSNEVWFKSMSITNVGQLLFIP